jgi:AcrR family transcriptional regulator
MPAVPKTNDEQILKAARALVERQGVDGLSMQALAAKVGIRAPSLYNRFADRDAIIDRLTLLAMGELLAALNTVPDAGAAEAELVKLAHVYRDFARRHPHLYRLLLANRPGAVGISEGRVATVQPLFGRLQQLLPKAKVLLAARTLVAFLHGFVSMELEGAFQLGGDVDKAFAFGVETIMGAVAGGKSPR